MANSTFLDYRMPTTLDVPTPRSWKFPTRAIPTGFVVWARYAIIAPLAALSNAIYHAIGVRLTRLPMSPGAILEALEAKP